MPCTAATTGTLAYLNAIEAFWNSATVGFEQVKLLRLQPFGDFLQVGAEGERRFVPDNEAFELFSARGSLP